MPSDQRDFLIQWLIKLISSDQRNMEIQNPSTKVTYKFPNDVPIEYRYILYPYKLYDDNSYRCQNRLIMISMNPQYEREL